MGHIDKKSLHKIAKLCKTQNYKLQVAKLKTTKLLNDKDILQYIDKEIFFVKILLLLFKII
jgi:hypothetical protein